MFVEFATHIRVLKTLTVENNRIENRKMKMLLLQSLK